MAVRRKSLPADLSAEALAEAEARRAKAGQLAGEVAQRRAAQEGGALIVGTMPFMRLCGQRKLLGNE